VSERALGFVVQDLTRVAAAGTAGETRDATVKRVRALAVEAYLLGRADERRESRKSLGRAWGAWLDLMMSVSLPSAEGKSLLQDVLDLEPELRERFEAAFLGEPRG
jgi:hypothetical protein